MTDTLRAKLNEHGLALQERELGPSNEPGDASAHPTLPQAPMPASWDLQQAPLSRFELSEQDRLRAMRSEAAGRQRFRPILMTTFTTVCGLIPMAVGNTKVVGTGYAPLGRTIMGGLLASMFLTLVIVPLCYTLFADLREATRRIVRSGVSRSAIR